MNDTTDISVIQRQMSEIRGEMRQDMQTLVKNARTLSDWRYYVRNYPWACMGAAAFVGYLLVPSRVTITTPAPRAPEPAPRPHAVQKEKEQKKGLAGVVTGMVMSAALRGASGIAMKMVNQYLESGKLEIPGFKSAPRPQRQQPHEEPHF
jgi:hypothetical protein